jgi:hypothetical protein
MRKKLVTLALGISLLTLGATVANAQFGKLLKTLKDAATELQAPTNVAAPSTSPANTLQGRWLPVEYSCTADKGQSDQVIEIVGREQRDSFGVCTYPQVFSNRTSYAGISKCSDEEGGETSYPQSYQIAADGTMAMAIKVDGKVVRTAWKRCSNPLYFVNEEVPSPVKTAVTRVTATNVSTLAGRWVPVAESCTGVRGVSERMIELKGKEMNGAFASCEFPAAISSRNAYKGSMSCSDEEGGETNKFVSIAIQQNGTMLWGEREGPGPISQDAYKKCSPAPRFPNE